METINHKMLSDFYANYSLFPYKSKEYYSCMMESSYDKQTSIFNCLTIEILQGSHVLYYLQWKRWVVL